MAAIPTALEQKRRLSLAFTSGSFDRQHRRNRGAVNNYARKGKNKFKEIVKTMKQAEAAPRFCETFLPGKSTVDSTIGRDVSKYRQKWPAKHGKGKLQKIKKILTSA